MPSQRMAASRLLNAIDAAPGAAHPLSTMTVKERSVLQMQPRAVQAPPARHQGSVAWTPQTDLEHPAWVAAGRRLGAIGRAAQWWVGDWVRYGTARWGERYVEAARITGYDVHSLRNMAYVAGRFELSLRRDNLTWSHHALLASLEPGEQRAWLNRASQDRLSVSDLRIELRVAERIGARASPDGELPAEPDSRDVLVCPNCGQQIPKAAK
jgi:hypothetical protein